MGGFIAPDGRKSGQTGIDPSPQDHSLLILPALLGRHQGDLHENMSGRRLLGGKRQLQVADNLSLRVEPIIEVALDHLFDDWPKIPVLVLEAPLVLPQEALKMMEDKPVEDRTLRTAKAIDSRHIGNADSKSVPGSGKEAGWMLSQRTATLKAKRARRGGLRF